MSLAATRVAIGAFASVDTSAMSVNGVRVPLIQILIEDFATMTVATSVIVNQSVLIAAESGMSVNGQRRQSTPINFTCQSSMTIAGNLKWVAESDTAETWNAISDNAETWTPITDTSETWAAISDNSESWTAIADNSETWQIAA
jgi:hypothetical protein